MEEAREDSGSLEAGTSGIAWWSSNFIEKFRPVSLVSQDDTLSSEVSRCHGEQDEVSTQTESQILWRTGTFSGPLCNGSTLSFRKIGIRSYLIVFLLQMTFMLWELRVLALK
ncbi:hypothetical protein MKW94_019639 [Papaver nudicaule]|uniref:Uncharacterized protein n=1 Tax=Papaver nudicaule TaxID=74823 RepID=A0AA42AZ24_PAPNU|nr:hypothetical protein [Papaver nudicaule]